MPDSAYVIACDKVRELRDAIEFQSGEMIGASKRAIAELAAMQWKTHASGFPYVLPLKNERSQDWFYGVFVSEATESEYNEYCETEGI
jgi:hypothetical protein